MVLKVFIVDDEAMTRNTLAALINKFCADVQIVGMAENHAAAVKALNEQPVDIVFMDINLGNHTGFDVLDDLLSYKAAVVFVTAYEEFAMRAFKYAAVNYLLKPVNHLELIETIARVRQLKMDKHHASLHGENSYERKRIAIPNKNGVMLIHISEMVYLVAEGSYTIIHLENKEKLTISKHLKQLEDILAGYPQFMRVHRSYIVNKLFIRALNRTDNGYLEMLQGYLIPIGNNYRKDVAAIFEN